jgi:quercetin dioxygenase-like cupin family protein
MRKRSQAIAMVLSLGLGFLVATVTLPGQDPLKVAPNNTKLLLENDQVRVFEFRAKPGEREPEHSHPAHVVYVVKGGRAKFTMKDGASVEQEMQAGQAIWGDPTTHTVDILGTSDVHVIAIELKNRPATKQ